MAWIKLGGSNFSNGTVTDEVTKSKNISDHCLVVRLAEHEGDEFADRGEYHGDMVHGLVLVVQVAGGFELLGYVMGDIMLGGNAGCIFTALEL